MTIKELMEKRAKVWEGAKAFVETHAGENGILSAEDNAAYLKMEKEIEDLTVAIDRQQRADRMEQELNKPVNSPLTGKPGSGSAGSAKTGRAADEYKAAMIGAFRSNFRNVSNVRQEGVDADGGYLVPEEYDRRLIDVLEEENIMRSLGTKITTSGQHKINIAATKPAASWIEEGGSEKAVAGLIVEDSDLSFTVRYCNKTAAVTADGFRVLFDGGLYNIVAIDHLNYKKKALKFKCEKARR